MAKLRVAPPGPCCVGGRLGARARRKTRTLRLGVLVRRAVRRFRFGLGLSLTAAGWLAATGGSVAGCGTDAVGVSECRELEQARCVAAASCDFPNVEECQRYYRDHCLHGVALEAIRAVEVDGCVRAIESAGRCAAEQGGATAPSACAEPLQTVGNVTSICAVVLQPEGASACAFLGPMPAPLPSSPVVVGDAGGS